MSRETVRIATRKSPLAIWQAEYIRNALLALYPDLLVEFVKMSTQGDKILDTALAKVGGKGLFVKELEVCILNGQADLAVHSMKDVPVEFPEGLHLPVICKREDPHDVFVSNHYRSLDELVAGARVGTSSLRRECQLRHYRSDLKVLPLRGNVNTRLNKLDNGEYDAIILAAAGLKRLGFAERIRSRLTAEQSLPAIGQGAVGIETREDDPEINALIAPLRDEPTWMVVTAERAMNKRLAGGCQVPIAGFAMLEQENIWMRGLVGRPDGTQLLRAEMRGEIMQVEQLGIELADDLLAQGADRILAEVYGQ